MASVLVFKDLTVPESDVLNTGSVDLMSPRPLN